MKWLLVVLVFILSGYDSYSYSENFLQSSDVKPPSYRMLAFSTNNMKHEEEKNFFQAMTPIETAEKFYLLKNKVDEGDAKTHYLLFLLYFDDSTCSEKSLVNLKRIADENCLIGLEYLNKAVMIDLNFQLGLYRLAYFNNHGVGMEIDLEQSIKYWERLIETKGYYRLLALEAASEIYFYEFGKIDKAKEYLTICANEGREICQFKLGDWDNKIKLRPYILEAKQRANSPST
ncbi:hypothetical protein AB6G26_04665 [Providencia hangzhouensis]|uniref:hypothetical protein n=1 Tax=Providencia hangzhouensis TaxID=3031799 RepID=UPI0034DD1FB2